MPAARPKPAPRRATDASPVAGPLQPVRLRAIHVGDFRRSPRANLAEALQAWPAPIGSLRDGEAILIESRGGNKLLFCFRLARGRDRAGKIRRAYIFRRWETEDELPWDATLLQTIAREVGLELVGEEYAGPGERHG